MRKTQKHLIVDGWNIIHSEAEFKRALLKDGQEGAKKLLSTRLAPIHDSLGYRLTIVYDGKGDDINVEKIGRSINFSEVYTPASMSADELIEQLCVNSKTPNSLLVASRDNLIRLTALGLQIESISSKSLLEWASSAAKNLSKKSEEISNNTKIEWKKSSPLAKLDEIIASKKNTQKKP